MNEIVGKTAQDEQRGRLLEVLTLALLTVQGGLTWRLWTGSHDYPRIPFVSWCLGWPATVDWGCLGLVILAWLFIVAGLMLPVKMAAQLRRAGWSLLLVGLAGSILLNQHRLQVWAWQGLLYAFCFASLSTGQAQVWLRRITVSLYAYSAISKFDFSFLQLHGQSLLEGLLKSLAWEPGWSMPLKFWLTGLFPCGELLVALLLIWPASYRIGWKLSLLMHGCLLMSLGPWGLNHHGPVLIWNLFFILQNPLLYAGLPVKFRKRSAKPPTSTAENSVLTIRQRIVVSVLWCSLLFPATEWFDLCDIWPGWGLYSARGAKVRLYLADDQLQQLPDEMQRFLKPSPAEQFWRSLDLRQWSFAEVNAPDYPEDRFQLGVALCIIRRLDPEISFLVQHEATANRWTGKRQQTLITNQEDLETFRQRYFFNVLSE